MKNKTYTICLNCGKVQLRTDIAKELNTTYIILEKKYNCPGCNNSVKLAATKNIKVLKKQLVENANTKMDNHLLNLIG